ncbi:MAG: helix-turn-helix transcriptional regulator [Prevotella sp.]|nr:helix-turn-helix transcriptional regulator [Prevotella sp.]
MAHFIFYFFILGFATAYFFIEGLHLLSARKFRFQHILGWIFLWWVLMSFKDILLGLTLWLDETVSRTIYFMDGCSAVTYIILFMEISSPGWVTRRRVLLLGLPFLLFVAGAFVTSAPWLQWIYTIFFVTLTLYYIVLSTKNTIRYTKHLRSHYSNTDYTDISWLWAIGAILVVMLLLWLIVSSFNNPWLDGSYYVLMILFWQIVMVHVKKIDHIQQFNIQQMCQDEEKEEQLLSIKPTPKSYPFAGEMERMIKQEQLYLNPELSVSDLVVRLCTNRTYISSYFSEVLHITFYEYINQMRIRQGSLPLMRRHPEYTLEHISEQSGFRSLSTFRRAFIKETGMSPMEYKKKRMTADPWE